MALGAVSELWRYPVSSLRGERLAEAKLDAAGVAGDRIWGMVDAETGVVADPDREKRWRVAPELFSRLRDGEAEVSLDGRDWLPVQSDAARDLASVVMGFPVAFRRHRPFGSAPDGDSVAPRYGRADLHIVTSASLAELARLIPPEARPDVRRFRPNIVIDTGLREPAFAEMEWIGRRISIGEAVATISEPCARCSFTALAQGDLPFARDVLHAISQHGDGGFGVLARIEAAETLRVGDRVSFL